jgi:hypothetical protein
MGKYLFILIVLISFAFCSCSKFPKGGETYYFYYAKEQFKRFEHKTDTSCHVYYSIRVSYPTDSLKARNVGKYYELDHFRKYSNFRDTIFVKHKSVLDTINYFDSEWIKKETNLNEFWRSRMGGGKSLFDSLEIYMIEPIEGTDSVIFRRVHRTYSNDID